MLNLGESRLEVKVVEVKRRAAGENDRLEPYMVVSGVDW